ncbi:hypothetical protein GL279_18975 [Paracoccus limosus]|uniref:Uncharacterized protein n=1 Tax=Paracoccus limosus TaxID=913252 RepID=A0A844HBD5_9RHOB|nr:hypothetical protein [Paracoccus limosus]MTH36657.1 hypothetical protein [Paracoccus limosus]
MPTDPDDARDLAMAYWEKGAAKAKVQPADQAKAPGGDHRTGALAPRREDDPAAP